ncbi:hypothetical protein FDP41_003577 [Naegleria fowleri]|uniref:UBC core domain-containing protein n=1 Tax=Naegleria fowleri TaxID=5763 RepID=A0A6A5BW80_NAEFO|nr:uncharacterized protein FDP41_003577 [Naegleria fowleri]KAF0977585.1 hypothetical protein FDP41_003577 [Naegleria fowleri]
MTWHATLLAHPDSDYAGIILHLVMAFPEDYPQRSCKVQLLNSLHHSHVHGDGHICLDMLQTHHSHERYFGWSSSYSVMSILLQLQAFLFEEEKDQIYYIQEDVNKSKKFKYLPHHDPENGKIWPCAPYWDVNAILNGKSALKSTKIGLTSGSTPKIHNLKGMTSSTTCLFMDLPQEMLIHIFDYLTTIELKTLEKVCTTFRQLVNSREFSTARELVCFYSKLTFREDTLGIGLFIYENKKGRYELSTSLDLIGYKAFHRDGVRKGVWNANFNFWLPLYINKQHANVNYFRDSIACIRRECPGFLDERAIPEKCKDDFPYLAMDLLSRLMNTMIVEIMKGYSHASIKALQGYCHFHRWMIYLAQTYGPELGILKSVHRFLNYAKACHKNECPDLGVFLRLSVLGPDGITWDSIKEVVVHEVTVRNAFWIQLKDPNMANLNDGNDIARVKISWESSQVSCRLIMFHVFFLRQFVEKHRDRSLEMIGRMYDVNYGCPEGNFEHVLQKGIFKILRISRLSEYFQYIGMMSEYLDSTAKIADYLRKCAKRSIEVGYTQPQQQQQKQRRVSSGSSGDYNDRRRYR